MSRLPSAELRHVRSLDAASSTTYATLKRYIVIIRLDAGVSETLELARPIFWVQERYDYRRIEYIWIAFRSIRQSVGGSRERFADYVASVIDGITNKQIIKYDNGNDWVMPDRSPSPETLDNFVNSISYSLKFLGIGGNSKFEASAKTISYIHVFLWQKDWKRMDNLEKVLIGENINRRRLIKGLDENSIILPPDKIFQNPIFLVDVESDKFIKHKGHSDLNNLDMNGIKYRVKFVIFFEKSKDKEESIFHFISAENWERLRGLPGQSSTKRPEASFKRWDRIGKGRATSVKSRQIVVNDETGKAPHVDDMIWQTVGALYDDLAKNIDYIGIRSVVGIHYRQIVTMTSSRRHSILKGGVCEYSGSGYYSYPKGALLGISSPSPHDINIIKNICKYRG